MKSCSRRSPSASATLEGTASGEDLGLGDIELPQIDINLDASELPGLDGPGEGQVGGGVWYIASTVAAERQAAAWDFIKFVNHRMMFDGVSPDQVIADAEAQINDAIAHYNEINF